MMVLRQIHYRVNALHEYASLEDSSVQRINDHHIITSIQIKIKLVGMAYFLMYHLVLGTSHLLLHLILQWIMYMQSKKFQKQ